MNLQPETCNQQLAVLRGHITRFINCREQAYNIIIKSGGIIPDIKAKRAAIKAIRIQLAASTTWSLESHYKWITAMRHTIGALLPYEFHDNPRQRQYRERIRQWLNHCEDQVTKTLYTQTKAA